MPKKQQLTRQQKTSIETLGNREVRNFEKNLFRMGNFGGAEEGQALIERYQTKITLTEKEKDILRGNSPEKPKFETLSRQQYEGRGCWKQRQYRKKVENYFEGRKKYYKAKPQKGMALYTPGQLFAMTKQQLDERFKAAGGETDIEEEDAIKKEDVIKEEETKITTTNEVKKSRKANDSDSELKFQKAMKETEELVEQYKEKGLYKEIEENADSMDEAYKERMDSEEYSKAEDEIAKKEIEAIKGNNPAAISMIKNYCYNGYGTTNKLLRRTSNISSVPGCTITLKAMKKNPLKRDLILRRGVSNINTAAHMLGLDNPDDWSEEDLKKELKRRYSSGEEMIMKEKGFMSTSLPDEDANFLAQSGSKGIGIEFIILAKKGSLAMNVSTISFKPEEREVLFAPGSKFKVVDMKLDGDSGIIKGHKDSWKIYLTSIPENEEGVLNKAA